MKSKAAILFKDSQRLKIKKIEVQKPRIGEVLVRMVVGGICHSDLHVIKGHVHAPLPAILGHEGAGIVSEIGPGVASIKSGDHVIPIWRLGCGDCKYCTSARPALCPIGTRIRETGQLKDGTSRFTLRGSEIKHFLGVSTFSEYSVIPERALLKIPRDFPLKLAALLGCGVITGVGAVINAARVIPGSKVAVFGTGGVGLNVIQGAVLAGAEKIIAVDILDNKLEFAKQFGATDLVNASLVNPVETVRNLTEGEGVDYAFEVVGLPKTIQQAFNSLTKCGIAITVGLAPFQSKVSIPIGPLVFEEKTLRGSLYGSSRPRIDILKLIDLYHAGKLKLDELITHTYPLEKIGDAFAALDRGKVARAIILF